MQSPMRFAKEPPDVKLPLSLGQPIAFASHCTTVRSIVVAAGPDRQAVAFWCNTLAANAPRTAIGSPEPNTYPKNRGDAGRELPNTSGKSVNALVPKPSR